MANNYTADRVSAGGSGIYSDGLSGPVVGVTLSLVEGGSDTVAVQVSAQVLIGVTLSLVEGGSDVVQVYASQGAPISPATVVVTLVDSVESDVVSARIAVSGGGVARGAFLWKVPAEYRLWPVQ